MKRLRWFLVIGIAVAIVVLILGQTDVAEQQGRAQTGDLQVLDEYIVGENELRVTVSGTGSVTPRRQVPLLTELPGVVEAVLVEVGQAVSAGMVLARVQADELQAAVDGLRLAVDLQRIAYDAVQAPARDVDIAAAQAAVSAAEAAIRAAYSTTAPQQAEIARLQSDLARNQLWQAQLQRDLQLQNTGGQSFAPDLGAFIPDDVDISQEAIDQANQAIAGLFPSIPGISAAQVNSINSGLTQAEFGVQIADASAAAAASTGANIGTVAQANAALVQAQSILDQLINGADADDLEQAALGVQQAELAVQQAEANLSRAELVAPFDGVIASQNLTAGEFPPSNGAAMLLVDSTGYYVELAIDETDIVRVENGQTVTFRFDALPDAEVTGVVDRVAVTPIIIGQLVTYLVRVQIEAIDAPIRIGMSATATIIVDQLNEALTVPNRFVRIDRTNGQAYVTVETEPGRFVETPVTLGLRSETESQIVDGVQAGDVLVLLPRGTFDLFDGAP